MTAAFRAVGITKNFGEVQALAGVDVEIGEGELFGLVGPNGAGKSTLVKIGVGLTSPSTGSVEVSGHPPRSLEARAALGYLAELFRFPGWLTAGEVLELHQRLSHSSGGRSERAALLELAGLSWAEHRRVEKMSKGMQQRLGIAQALVGSPNILFLDEPTSALDPDGRHAVRGLLKDLKERGVAVLLNSHLLSEVELVCDRVAILNEGRIVAEGTPQMLSESVGVEVETDDGIRSYPEARREDIPDIIAALVAENTRVYAVRGLHRSLEETYLEVVRGQAE